MQVAGTRILITGASSGIGEALSKLMAKHGARVILVSENQTELQRVTRDIAATGGDAVSVTLDLTSSDRAGAIARLEAEHGPIDVLINNAGMGLGAAVTETKDKDLRLVFELNFFASFDLARQALQQMRSRQRGVIVNVTSAAARLGSPGISVYSATKGAVHAFSQALRIEAAASGIQVCECLPISVQTKFFANARGSKYTPGGVVITPERVAFTIYRAISRNQVPCEILPFRPIRLAFVLDACLPGVLPSLAIAAQNRRIRAEARDHNA